MSNMSEEKKARLEAIRAAKRAAAGEAPAAAPETATPAAPATTEAPAATPVAPVAVGSSMSDEKKAKLEAIRAANAAKKAAATDAPATAAPATAAPATAQAAAPAKAAATPAAKPATPSRAISVPKPAEPVADDPQPRSALVRRAIVGAIFAIILCVLLATMTDKYILAVICGLLVGVVGGPLVLGWPPQRTTGD
jgi:hypothetical protein